LTNSWPSIFFSQLRKLVTDLLLIMKKFLILSMLICFTMICSCQKQDSAAEQELAQRKTELDAREKALDEKVNVLDERMNALSERVNSLSEKQKAMANAGTIPTDTQGQTPDPAQVQAERDRTVQQFSAEMRALIPEDSKTKTERDRARWRAPEELQKQRQPKLKMSGGAVFPAPEAASPTPSPAIEATSPTASPTPE
jgi:hypothetical protein